MSHANYDDWFRGVVTFYRTLDFFTAGKFTSRSVADCQKLIEGSQAGWYQESYRHAVQYAGNELAALEAQIIKTDDSRVWFQDSEWVYGDTHFYQTGVAQLGRISRTLFQPADPREVWESVQEVDVTGQIIRVTFQVGGEEHGLWIWRDSDCANTGFVSAVNELVRPAGQQFRIYGADQDWLVICQAEDELAAMLERGLVVRDLGCVSGLLQHPEATVLVNPRPRDRCLYAQRGVYRHRIGDVDGAWDDLRQAAKLGMRSAYALIE